MNFGDGSDAHSASVVPAIDGNGYLVLYGCPTLAVPGTFQSRVSVRGADGVEAALPGPEFAVTRG